jgi:hypothetical protein
MSGPYNPAPGSQPGEQPQWGGYPGGANYPQQSQPGYPGQDAYQQGGYQGYQQGGYQQPGYQQGGYQQPQGGYSYPQQTWGYGTARRETVGVIGLIGAAVGAALLIVGFTAVKWYSFSGLDFGKFSDFNDDLKNAGSAAPGLAKAYFGWLGWVLLVLVIVAAVLASLPIGTVAMAFRIVAPVVGVAGIVVTLLALNSYWDKAQSSAASANVDVGVFKHTAVGLYLTLIGFLIAGVAGVFGPRRA